MEKQDKVTLVAVGDIGPDRDEPESIFAHTAPVLREGDITFGQLETNFSERGIPQVHRGPAPRAHPKNVAALTYAGFDIVSFASNHALDWNDDALFDTLDVLRKNNIVVIGAGKNIEEARQPAIIERKGTRVGFLAYCSVVPQGFEAEENKPGVAPVRATTSYEQVDWQAGTPPRIISRANPNDLAAMVTDIKRLRPNVDILVVSLHWGIHFMPSTIAMYQYEVGHAAIDAGADLIVGHHAHILKGIEVYKGKVILYSLCNFAFDLRFPPDFVESPRFKELRKLLNPDWEIDPDYPTYPFPADSRKTILVKCILSNKQIERVSFLPTMVNKQSQPYLLSRNDKRFDEVVNYIKKITAQQGLNTKYTIEGDEVMVWPEMNHPHDSE
jgi:poly-gamma-glutamate capsule biosynthesis protein CapA/YwtB (metallophosphatase superfamily)